MVRDVACCNSTCDAKAWWIAILRLAIFTKQSKTIHRGISKGWDVFLGYDVFGQYQPWSFRKWYVYNIQRFYFSKYAGESFFYANHLSTAFQQDSIRWLCAYCIS